MSTCKPAVIGGDAVGKSAASQAKRRQPEMEIVVFERSPHTSLSACGIPYYIDGVRTAIRAGFAIIITGGTNHNIINTGTVPMKLYTIYSPQNHRDGVVHHTRAEAKADNEHFDGKTTE